MKHKIKSDNFGPLIFIRREAGKVIIDCEYSNDYHYEFDETCMPVLISWMKNMYGELDDVALFTVFYATREGFEIADVLDELKIPYRVHYWY